MKNVLYLIPAILNHLVSNSKKDTYSAIFYLQYFCLPFSLSPFSANSSFKCTPATIKQVDMKHVLRICGVCSETKEVHLSLNDWLDGLTRTVKNSIKQATDEETDGRPPTFCFNLVNESKHVTLNLLVDKISPGSCLVLGPAIEGEAFNLCFVQWYWLLGHMTTRC